MERLFGTPAAWLGFWCFQNHTQGLEVLFLRGGEVRGDEQRHHASFGEYRVRRTYGTPHLDSHRSPARRPRERAETLKWIAAYVLSWALWSNSMFDGSSQAIGYLTGGAFWVLLTLTSCPGLQWPHPTAIPAHRPVFREFGNAVNPFP